MNNSFLPNVTAEQKTTEKAEASNYNWSNKVQNKMPEIVIKSADGRPKQAEITRGSADNYILFNCENLKKSFIPQKIYNTFMYFKYFYVVTTRIYRLVNARVLLELFIIKKFQYSKEVPKIKN